MSPEQDLISKQAEFLKTRNIPIFHNENGAPTHWWASICSGHYFHSKDCFRCVKGSWVRLPIKDLTLPTVAQETALFAAVNKE